MATVKVKFRKSTVPGRTGSIYYQVSHRGKMLQIPTPIRLHPEEWESSRRQIAGAGSDSFVQFRIESDLAVLNRIIQRFELAERDYDVGEIALLLSCVPGPSAAGASPPLKIPKNSRKIPHEIVSLRR